MTRVLIVAHHLKDDARKAAMTAADWLREHGHTAWMPGDDATQLDLPELAGDAPSDSAELVLSLGGDGTMLRAVGALDGASVPLLGVNLGRLGYLTEVEVEGMVEALQRFVAGPDAGGWHLDRRMMLAVDVRDGDGTPRGRWCALNEAVVEKQTSGQTVQLQLLIDGEPFTSYAADGLIVSTPTGSTAYSFSARGPIVSPDVRCLVLTPIAAHMVFDRSFVLGADQQVILEVVGDEPGVLSADGRESVELPVGSRARIGAAELPARLVRRADAPPFLARVRDKFELPGDPTDADDDHGDVGSAG